MYIQLLSNFKIEAVFLYFQSPKRSPSRSRSQSKSPKRGTSKSPKRGGSSKSKAMSSSPSRSAAGSAKSGGTRKGSKSPSPNRRAKSPTSSKPDSGSSRGRSAKKKGPVRVKSPDRTETGLKIRDFSDQGLTVMPQTLLFGKMLHKMIEIVPWSLFQVLYLSQKIFDLYFKVYLVPLVHFFEKKWSGIPYFLYK